MASVVGAYARAFADVVVGSKLDPARLQQELHTVEALLADSDPLRRVLENPSIPGDRKRAVLDALAQRGDLWGQRFAGPRQRSYACAGRCHRPIGPRLGIMRGRRRVVTPGHDERPAKDDQRDEGHDERPDARLPVHRKCTTLPGRTARATRAASQFVRRTQP